MKTPRLILEHLRKLEEYGYVVGEDMTEDGTPYTYVMRPDGDEEAFALTWAFQRTAEVRLGNETVH